MLRPFEAPPLERVDELLAYNPATKRLHWRVSKPPMIRPGDVAGNVHKRDGFVGITLDGRRYQAQYLSYYLATGFWPSTRLRFADLDKTNLDPHNLVKESDRYSPTKQAAANRKRAAEVRKKRREMHEQWEQRAFSNLLGRVRYNKTHDAWEVMVHGRDLPVGTFATMEEAETLLAERAEYAGFLSMNPYRFKFGDDILRTGAELYSPTYAEIANVIAYDPQRGFFYYRHDAAHLRADYLNTHGRRVVTFWGRQYPAAMLAWFLAHRQWPKRKSITARDGNPDNVKLTNLLRKHTP